MKVFFLVLMLCFFPKIAMTIEINYFVIDDQARPLQIEEEGKNHSGIVTELVQEIFKGTEHKINYITVPFARMLANMEDGGHPNWLHYGSLDWPGPHRENLSKEKIQSIRHAILTRKKDKMTFSKTEDLYNKNVFLLLNYNYKGLDDLLMAKKVIDSRPRDYEAAFQGVDSREKMGFIEMDLRIKYNLKQSGRDLKNYDLTDLSFLIPPLDIYLSLDPKMDKNLQDFVNQKLTKLIKAGFVQKLFEKYN